MPRQFGCYAPADHTLHRQTTTRDRFAGHIGHLSEAQKAALDAFKGKLEQAGLYKPVTDSTKASHDDVTLV